MKIVFIAIFAITSADDNEILNKNYDLKEDGSYGWEYETGNGISASENGKGGEFAKGVFEWTSPEGEHVSIQYTADENGYQPSGSHVPAVPDYIVRALEYIKAHPPPPEK
ncbi:pupal cuticle protein-like [Condylostylus longicornis]|uniref:pupal cuticle protein-like n=1 Tax=Condylostylus longicornis TaxID=2530218 RepID=UPI00244E3A60|nr:pupal cuticle protein-like [Condylostylus longicornis]